MRVLITGITGFVGSHMADYLLDNVDDVEVYALKRWRSNHENIEHLIGHPKVKLYECDLLDRSSLNMVIRDSKPDVVYHFAAQSFPETSFQLPVQTLTTNVIGTTNLLEELRLAKDDGICNPLIVSVSSSEVYGNPKREELPMTESQPLRAANPYSISKVAHDFISEYYHTAYDMKVIITRMFSHEGSRRGKMFALSWFAHQVVQNEKGNGDGYIRHGNLDSVRTYSHIDDAVHAYWLVKKKGRVGQRYNIGGDYTCTVGDALNMLISKSTKKGLEPLLDQDRVRPTDITLQVPDTSKFRKETGWEPTKGLEEICDDHLDYWREKL